MMMQKLMNAMLQQAAMQNGSKASNRFGLVTSYDPQNYCVKVSIQPEGSETGWLPLLTPWVGNGWGMFAPPKVGDMVEVSFLEGDFEAGYACLRAFNDSDRPLNVPSGEIWFVSATGAFFKLLNNGAATVSDGNGATITLNGDGTITSAATQWNHTGNVKVTGNIVATQDISDHTNKSMAAMRSVYNGHTHSDPQGGSVGTPSAGM